MLKMESKESIQLPYSNSSREYSPKKALSGAGKICRQLK
jgi:hypothetical protein